MKNQTLINSTISTIGFELELSDKRVRFNTKNPAAVQRFINNIQEEFADELAANLDAKQAVEQLQSLLDEHNTQTVNVSKDDLKEVYLMLKDRKLHPVGEFDKRGRFYLEDDELVDVRPPSASYPYSQMSAGRTSKFVKAMAEKYKVQSKDEVYQQKLITCLLTFLNYQSKPCVFGALIDF